jgi:hypothetical protein
MTLNMLQLILSVGKLYKGKKKREEIKTKENIFKLRALQACYHLSHTPILFGFSLFFR